MNKKEESLRNVRVRVNQNVSKATKKELKAADFDKLLAACQKQNEIIDLFAYANKTLSETTEKLVESKLCDNLASAKKRVLRHKHADITSAISTRLARLFERANVVQDVVQDDVVQDVV